MKNQLLFFFLLFSILSFSQEKRKIISGKIIFNKDPISDVHIVNKSTNIGTISNDDGWFEIPVIVGDNLVFSHINLKEKQVIISKQNIIDHSILIFLEEQTYTLDEIVLEKPSNFLYDNRLKMPAPIVNAKTLNLPYANTTAKKNNAIVSFKSGGVVNLNNLINALNGNNKRKKELLKISREDNSISKIRKYFTDDFFITDLKIKKENINAFLNYSLKKGIISNYKKGDVLKLTKSLLEQSKTFSQKITSDIIIATKK